MILNPQPGRVRFALYVAQSQKVYLYWNQSWTESCDEVDEEIRVRSNSRLWMNLYLPKARLGNQVFTIFSCLKRHWAQRSQPTVLGLNAKWSTRKSGHLAHITLEETLQRGYVAGFGIGPRYLLNLPNF